MKRARALLCMALATAALLFAAHQYSAAEVLAVIAVTGEDPMRTQAYVNGIEVALLGEKGLQAKRFETDGSPASLRRIAEQLRRQRYCGVLTNGAGAAAALGELGIPVLAMGAADGGICMAADERDEMDALLSYAGQSNLHSLAVLVPEREQVPDGLTQWLSQHQGSRLLPYSTADKNALGAFDSIAAQQVDAVLVWGQAAQAAQVIMLLRHVGYTGTILGPSFLQDYEALGMNAGQAAGIRFAAQYTDPRHSAASLTRRQQQFTERYTAHFKEAPLFAQSYLGADQVQLFLQLRESGQKEQTPLDALAQCGRVQGLVQPYDFGRNPRTGVSEMVVYEISSGRMAEAR